MIIIYLINLIYNIVGVAQYSRKSEMTLESEAEDLHDVLPEEMTKPRILNWFWIVNIFQSIDIGFYILGIIAFNLFYKATRNNNHRFILPILFYLPLDFVKNIVFILTVNEVLRGFNSLNLFFLVISVAYICVIVPIWFCAFSLLQKKTKKMNVNINDCTS